MREGKEGGGGRRREGEGGEKERSTCRMKGQ